MVFHWSLSDSKSPQVSRTLLSILAVLNNAVVWIVSSPPPTSKSSNPFSNPLVTVPNAPITVGIIVTCMFHSFFNSLTRSRYFIIIIIIIIIIIVAQEFFPSVITCSFLLKFEGQQDFSSLQDVFLYSGCSLGSLHPSRYFQVLQSL